MRHPDFFMRRIMLFLPAVGEMEEKKSLIFSLPFHQQQVKTDLSKIAYVLSEKFQQHSVEKLRVVLIGVMTSIRNHNVATIQRSLCPPGSMLFDLFERILGPMCEQERHGQPIARIFMKKTRNGLSHRNPCF